jgi:hypothetical protein
MNGSPRRLILICLAVLRCGIVFLPQDAAKVFLRMKAGGKPFRIHNKRLSTLYLGAQLPTAPLTPNDRAAYVVSV